MNTPWIYLLATAWLSLAHALCPPTGPVLPPPKIPSDGNLTSSLNQILKDLAKSGIWNTTTTSFSVEITSTEETFFTYHHTAPKLNTSGVDKVDGETIYRVASVTKVITTLALLLQDGLSLDDPIAKYVPELREIDRYKDVTLRMLASQLSGMHREGYTFDLTQSVPREELLSLGFPDVPRNPGTPLCDTLDSPLCTRSQFFKDLDNTPFVWQPGQRAAYSNPAYILLGFALEHITGIAYTDLISEQITKPLGLSSATGFSLEDISNSVIPIDGGSLWVDLPIGNYKATAGMYSTPDDLARFVRGILQHKLLSVSRTDLWLKPAVYLSSLTSAVGMPWEIFRTTAVTPKPRPIDVYTKSGNFGTYGANIAIIPEYNIGIAINAAGQDSYTACETLLSEAVRKVVETMDRLARVQARDKYAGRYTSRNGSLVLVVDEGPGLKIKEWKSQGHSVLEAWAKLSGDGGAVDARIYPVGEDDRWRVTFENKAPKTGLFKDACYTWFQVDKFRYQGLPVDEIDFVVGGGRVEGLRVPGLRQNLTKA
ncbi:hypothetical protein ACJ41O_008856 [Fusarium nematophilum]